MKMKTTLTAILLSAATLSAAALTDGDATYRLTLNSIPAGSSWYQILDASDWSSPALDSDGTVELRAGAEYHVMTFPDEGFVFREWCVADTLLTPDRLGMFTMPAHDATMTGRFEYDPASPPGPGSNHWNPQTGELIIDEFKPGYLSSAIYQATGGAPGKIHALTVAGKMTDNDYQAVARCGECTFFDFSRTTGASSVPGGSFANSAAETVILPASTEWLLGTAMYGCRALTSLTIHSLTPPLTGTDALKGVPDGLIVYVPAAALEQYRESPAWSGFTLLPITADIRSVTVTLPDETAASDYKDMWLELVNTKSGQRIHYVMTGRTQYTFANIIRDTSWEIILRNERGDIFGRIDNVEVKDEDVSVCFVSLSKPQNVMLTILTPEGNDVTDETKITWTDASGNYMSQGASLTGLPAACQVNYSVALSQQLAMSFVTPSVAGYVVQDGDNNLTCRLAAVGQTSVSGRVTDAATGMPLDGATVSASQTFGDRYTKTVNARTNRKGLFTLDIADVPATLAFAASDYVSKTMTCDPLSDGTTTVTLPDVALSAITGATVSIGFTYTTCSDDEVEAETRDWYSDWQNVSYTLFNVTRNRPVEQYSVQYPQIVLLEDIEDGDMLRLTATSRTNAFMPVDCTVTIAQQTASATFDITEPGKIQATFARTENASVTGSLYDSTGKLVKMCPYIDATLTVSGVADGRYTLVTMGDSNLYNTIYDMTQLPQTGLTEGTDYVKNQVEVRSGIISKITIDEVPPLDESKLYYTGENTSFTVNKTSIVAGNYLTLTGRIDFKSVYSGNVSNVQMIVDLPESCSFVENSVMAGNSTSGYTLDGQRLIIPLHHWTDRVRFCIIPTQGGEYAPSALVRFELDGATITQPIGSARYEIKNLDFNVPTTICSEKFQVNGIAPGSSQIKVYEDGAVIGNTRALANGTWSAECTLPETYNLTTHTIYAIITTKEGMDIESESAIVELDRRCATPKTVLMTFYNGWLHKNINVTFDFTNLTISNPEYMFYTKTKLSFVADFTDNNPEHLTDVTLWTLSSNNAETPITMSYDETSGKWIGSHDFDFYTAPINLTLEYTYNGQKLFDRKQLSDFNEERESILTDNLAERANFIEAFDSEMPEDEFTRELAELLSQEDPDDEEIRRLLNMSDESGETTGTEMSDEEFDALCQQVDDSWAEWEVNGAAKIRETVLTDYFADPKYDLLSDYEITSELEDGTKTVSKKGLTSVNREELEANGYSAITLDDGSEIYVLYCENLMEIIDCGQLVKYSIIVEHSNSPAMMARTNMPVGPIGNYLSFATAAKNAIQTIYYLSTTDERRWLVDVVQKIHEATDGISKFYENYMNDFIQNIQCAYDGLSILCDEEIETQEALAEAAQDRIKKYTAKIEANKKQREVLKSNRDFVKSSTTISEDQKQRLIKEYDEKIQRLSDENKHLNGKRVGTNTQLNKANSRIASIKEKITQFRRVHTKIRETLDKFPKRLAKGLRLPKVLRLCGKVAGDLGVPLQCWSLVNDMMDMADDISEWIPLMDRIDAHHCYKKGDPNAVICHESIYDRANWHAWNNVGILVSEIGAIGFSKAGGVPGSYSWWGEMGCSALAELWKYFNDRASLNERTRFWIEVGLLKCNDKDDDNHKVESKGKCNISENV